MDQPSLEAVVQRLDRVERESRRWKVASLLAIAALASVLLMGQSRTPSVIEAERFVVRDQRGVEVAFFGADHGPDSAAGSGMLAFYTYRPDGKRAIGTFMTEGNGEGFLSLNSGLENGSVTLRTGYGGTDASINIAGPVGPSGRQTVWSAP